jgi:hypothetical protein
MIPPAYFLPYPPSVADNPIAFAISLSGLMIVTLIFADWVYEMGRRMLREPLYATHPRTVFRLIIFLTGISGVIRNAPDVALWGLWRTSSPALRFFLASWNRILDGVSGPFQTMAWLLLVYGAVTIEFQLGREPLPIKLYPTWAGMVKPISLTVMVAGMCFAIAFLT